VLRSITAGYGDPLFRDPDSVLEELKTDIISHWTAINIYKVVYDQDTFTVDYERTREERQREREHRKKRSKPYDQFEREWLKKSPPEEALECFGSWPDGMKNREITWM